LIVAVPVGFVVAMCLPEWLTAYPYKTVSAARAWGNWEQVEDAKIVDELGDTNGPYRLLKSRVGGVGKPFDFDLSFRGTKTNWSQPVSNHMWFVVTVFENRHGNQFAVVRKRTE
jgi:hypothetical protein